MNLETFNQIKAQWPSDVKTFIRTGSLTDNLYNVLFDHYCNTNEMPYGTAKARTGDPYEWIESHFSDFLEIEGIS
jgi:hypothetical protein